MEKFLLQAVIVGSLMINFSLSYNLGLVRGEKSDIRYFPYQAAYIANGKFKCGATVISEKCALTAGKRSVIN